MRQDKGTKVPQFSKMTISKKYLGPILTFFAAFCLLFMLAFLNGCRKTPVYNIGFMGPLGGDKSSYDSSVQAKAVEMAVKEFNTLQEEHGYRIGLIVKDSKGDPEVAVKAAEKILQEDKIVALLGPFYSNVAFKVADLLLRNQVPMMSGSAVNSKLTAKSAYIFRTIVSNWMQSMVLGPYVANILGHDSTAILYTKDKYSTSLAQDFESRYELAGGRITLSLGAERKQTGYRDELERLRDTRPEALFLPNIMADTLTMLKNLREIGWNVPVISGSAFHTDNFFATVGNLAEGVTFSTSLIPQSPVTIEFRERFQALYGMEPDNFTYNIYDATNIVLGAIHSALEASSTFINGSSVCQYIQKTKNYPGVSGTINFNESGDVLKGFTLMQVQGKSFKSLGNFTVSGDQVIMLP